MKYYKQIINNELISIGTIDKGILPATFTEISQEEYQQITAEIIAAAEAEPIPEPDPFDNEDYAAGYEQALLDLMELEMAEIEEEA